MTELSWDRLIGFIAGVIVGTAITVMLLWLAGVDLG